MSEWPWRKPLDIIRGWKFSYTGFGSQFLLERWRDFFYFHFYVRHTPKFKRELRRVYLGSRIRTLETLRKWAEEKADGLDQKVP